ncbi:MAG: TOBE domain-containing protein, partial [Pseudomonadota bacterium]
EAPNSVYVADFLGDVTIIAGQARKDGNVYDVSWAQGQPHIRVNSDRQVANGPCHIAIRPEKVEISHDRPDDDNVLPGKVIDIAYFGNLSTYHVELANGQILKAQSFNTERETRQPFTWEDEVFVNWTVNCAVLLES